MKILLYATSMISKTSFGILSDMALKFNREGNDVYFVYCAGLMDVCPSNSCGNEGLCKTCKLWCKKAVSYLDKNIKVIKLKEYAEVSKHKWNYNNVTELREICIDKNPLGMTVLSTYIDFTRNLTPLVDENSKQYFDHLLDLAYSIQVAFQNLQNEFCFDSVYLFNCRRFDTRPAFEYMKNVCKDVHVIEVISASQNVNYYIEDYGCSMPHDLDTTTKRINEVWVNDKVCKSVKCKVAEQFYYNRRHGIYSGDKIYVKEQEKGLLPPNMDPTKRNYVIFNSSEDELAAIGGKFDTLPLFKSQIDGIKSILDHYQDSEDVHIYIRVHPNLKHVKYSYHLNLYEFERQYKNVTVIPADSSISTYSLLDIAEKVIVFGSTIGIEASYWKKPVILLGASYYYYMDVCYTPKNINNMFKLLDTNNLQPLSSDGFYKYAYYITAYKDRTINKNRYYYLDFRMFKMKLGNWESHGLTYQKILGSKTVFLLYISIIRTILTTLYPTKYIIPINEVK